MQAASGVFLRALLIAGDPNFTASLTFSQYADKLQIFYFQLLFLFLLIKLHQAILFSSNTSYWQATTDHQPKP